MTNNQNIDILTEIVNRNYEESQRQKRIQQKKAESARMAEELFAMANKPGIERRQREAAKARQEAEWQDFKEFFFKCLWLLTIVLLICDALMLGVLIWGMFL